MLNPILARFAATPSLVAPEMREWFESSLAGAAGHSRIEDMLSSTAQAEDDFWPAPDDWRAAYRPYVVRAGVLQIPVKGVLLHDFSFALGGWATGYVYIRRALERGLADPNVKGIALVCDSPGGHVAGNFELVDRIRQARSQKPIRAFAHEGAYSAAYSIASAAQTVIVSRTGGVGSIGVVAAHLDVSSAMEQAGLKVTFIFAGKHKVDGNAYEALPDDVRDRLQARIDELYAVFVTTVSLNRGLSEEAVRGTEALCFSATEATSNGLADEIGALDDALSAFADDLIPTEEDDEMSDDKGAAPTIAVAEHEEKLKEAVASARATSIQRSEASEIAKLCVDSGVPAMAASLLAEGVTLAQARERVGAASQVKELVALAGRTDPSIQASLADQYLAEGKTVEQVRAALFDKLVAKQEQTQVSSHVPAAEGEQSVDAIFASAGYAPKKRSS